MIHALYPGATAMRYRHAVFPFLVGFVLLAAGHKLSAAPVGTQALFADVPVQILPVDLTGLGATLTGLALVCHGLAAIVRALRGVPETVDKKPE